jgi:Mn2+/Fe2+ NRAMP family transporter
MSVPNSPTVAANSRSDLWKALGPGILVACAAVGGSHLVWSTSAGARYGWSLAGLIILANVLKFPFFYFGQRYTAATGESLLAGYKRHGIAYVWIFLLINVLTGAVNIAGVGMLSGALFAGYGFSLSVPTITVGLLAVCAILLLVGHYWLLDWLAKVIIAFLAVATIVAVALAWGKQHPVDPAFVAPSPWTWVAFPFLINLLGWMPAPVDLSAWSSLWMFSRERQTGHMATVRETGIDFWIGYTSTAVLAILFLALGAFVMFGTGMQFSEGGIGFSNQLVTLYTQTIGEWTRPLILSAAFITMFSTTLTCVDGYPRSLAASCSLIWDLPPQRFLQIHRLWMVLSTILASLIVLFFVKNLLQLLEYATVVSFVTSPILAVINHKVMNGPNVPQAYRPSHLVNGISICGLIFFFGMTAAYIYVLIEHIC